MGENGLAEPLWPAGLAARADDGATRITRLFRVLFCISRSVM